MARGKKKESVKKSKFTEIQPIPKKLHCITGCGRKPRTEDFCSNCYVKFLRGHFRKDGSKHPDIVAKEKALEIKRAKRQLKANAKKIEDDKQHLRKYLSRDLLKVLQNTDPETDKSKFCPHWDFWTSDAICYGRLFILNKKDCDRCHEHDGKIEMLKTFVKEQLDDKKLSGEGNTAATTTNAGTGEASK
jgi:hypothetical protein